MTLRPKSKRGALSRIAAIKGGQVMRVRQHAQPRNTGARFDAAARRIGGSSAFGAQQTPCGVVGVQQLVAPLLFRTSRATRSRS
jgi:hypothetical protein